MQASITCGEYNRDTFHWQHTNIDDAHLKKKSKKWHKITCICLYPRRLYYKINILLKSDHKNSKIKLHYYQQQNVSEQNWVFNFISVCQEHPLCNRLLTMQGIRPLLMLIRNHRVEILNIIPCSKSRSEKHQRGITAPWNRILD